MWRGQEQRREWKARECRSQRHQAPRVTWEFGLMSSFPAPSQISRNQAWGSFCLLGEEVCWEFYKSTRSCGAALLCMYLHSIAARAADTPALYQQLIALTRSLGLISELNCVTSHECLRCKHHTSNDFDHLSWPQQQWHWCCNLQYYITLCIVSTAKSNRMINRPSVADFHKVLQGMDLIVSLYQIKQKVKFALVSKSYSRIQTTFHTLHAIHMTHILYSRRPHKLIKSSAQGPSCVTMGI